MDKKIKAVKKSMDKKLGALIKMDIPRDKKLKNYKAKEKYVKKHVREDISDYKKEIREDKNLIRRLNKK